MVRKKLRERVDRAFENIIRRKANLWRDEITGLDVESILNEYNTIHYSTLPDEKKEILDEMLARLDKHLFDIVTMHYFEGKTLGNIAEIYGKEHPSWTQYELKRAYVIMRGVV